VKLRPIKRLAAPAVALLALALGLAACGEKSEDVTGGTATPFKLTLDFYPNPDHAGIYMAQQRGYFKDAGLEVSIETPGDPSTPIKEVAAGRTDLAVSYEPEVVLARDQGLDVVSVGALVDQPLTSMIWLKKSGIKGIAGLRGKTIATAGIPYQDAYLKTILDRAHLTPSDVSPVNVGFGLLPALVGGKAQAMLGGFSNIEGVDLRRARTRRQRQQPGRRPAGDPALPGGALARHQGGDRRTGSGRGGTGRSESLAGTAARQGRARSNAAGPLPRRSHESRPVDEVHRLDARQRADLLAPERLRNAQQRLPAGQDLRIAGQALGQQA
jgi:hypothetical protein